MIEKQQGSNSTISNRFLQFRCSAWKNWIEESNGNAFTHTDWLIWLKCTWKGFTPKSNRSFECSMTKVRVLGDLLGNGMHTEERLRLSIDNCLFVRKSLEIPDLKVLLFAKGFWKTTHCIAMTTAFPSKENHSNWSLRFVIQMSTENGNRIYIISKNIIFKVKKQKIDRKRSSFGWYSMVRRMKYKKRFDPNLSHFVWQLSDLSFFLAL